MTNPQGLCERLRKDAEWIGCEYSDVAGAMREAAARIEELERERDLADVTKRIAGLLEQHARDSAELRRLCGERDHWKANHANQVARSRVLVERTDMPLERVKAYELIGQLQDRVASLEAQLRERGEPVVDYALAAALLNWPTPSADYHVYWPRFPAVDRTEREPETKPWPFTPAAASEELLREIAALKRYDPNSARGFSSKHCVLNPTHDLMQRIDAAIASQKEKQG